MSESDSEVEAKELEWKKKVAEMRERVKNHLNENTVEGKREKNLYHGIKLVSSTMMLGKFIEICYCEETQEYLVIDPPSNMLRYSVQGKLIQPSYTLSATMLFTKLIWCQKAKVLIGYVPNDDMIWFMTSFCMLYQVVRNEFRITAIFYEPTTNEAIVTGPNKITRFPLTNKEAIMNPWKTMSYIDSEYGALWKLECTSLIPASTSMLRMAGSYMTTLYILTLETSKEKEEAVPLMFLARNPGATEASITVLLFQTSSQWVITGDEQGNVKGWDLDLNCTMRCSGIHSAPIRQIALHPSICGFITYAEDNILQIWSCNLRGKMESFSDIAEVRGIAVNVSAAAIATLGQKLCCFNMQQLYTFYTALSESARQIISTTNPMFSTRVIVRSADNTIRILTSVSGKQINIQILPKTLNLVSMAYSGNNERLYTIISKTGEVLVSNSQMNPMEFKHVLITDGSIITCITAYEYYEEIRDYSHRPQNPRVIYPKYVLIFAGTEDGAIVNINEESGKHEARFAAHNGPVIKLWSSTISRFVLSVGVDKCVKVWKVYADLAVPLALAHTVYYTVPITHIVSMGSVICMVSSTTKASAHQLFMYDTIETVRLDHHPSKDHTEMIVDIAASESLQICATSSVDNTIRLWDHQNILIKVLEINTCANYIAFSSLRGDIVFGAGRHLYKISYQNYLAPKYKARILVNGVPEETDEEPRPENIEYRIYDDVVNRDVLLHPVSSTPLGSLDNRDGNAPRLELMIQQQMCAQLQRRDEDIINIKKGEIKAAKLVAEKALMSRDAWEKYLEDILKASNRAGTEIPPHDIWMMIEKYKTVKRSYNKFGIFKMIYGYSIEKFPQYPDTIPDSVEYPRLPLFGFLPNSVIYKLYSDEDFKRSSQMPKLKPLIKYKYPPEFLLHESDSSRLNSNIEISPSELINMTRTNDLGSDATILNVAISENQNPFVKMARYALEHGHNSKIKKHKIYKARHKKLKTKKINSRAKAMKPKIKKYNLGIPLAIEKIIYGDQQKLEMILSQAVANEKNIDTFSWKNTNNYIPSSGVCGLTFDNNANQRSTILTSEKIMPFAECKPKENLLPLHHKKLKDQMMQQEFISTNHLANLGIKEIKAKQKIIKQTLKNDYGSVSIAHDKKIKNVLMTLLKRFINKPSSFPIIMTLVNILPVQDIEIVGLLCTIFIITHHRNIRKSVMKYLKKHGLKDPQKIFIQQLLTIKNMKNIGSILAIKKFIIEMISSWMCTLKKHVALIIENTRYGDSIEHMRNLLKKEIKSCVATNLKSNFDLNTGNLVLTKETDQIYNKWDQNDKYNNCVTRENFIEERLISPIDGINYFCELNTIFLKKVDNIQRPSRLPSDTKHKAY